MNRALRALVFTLALSAFSCGATQDLTNGTDAGTQQSAVCKQPGDSCTNADHCVKWSCACVNSGCADGLMATNCYQGTCVTQSRAQTDCGAICNGCGGMKNVTTVTCP